MSPFIVIILLLSTNTASAVITVKVINNLTRTLMQDYNINTLPAANYSERFQINVSASLLALGDLDEVEEKFSTVMSVYYEWTDASMRWNPDEYEGITNITMDFHHVWTPEFVLANPHQGYSKSNSHGTHTDVRFKYTGEATAQHIMILETSCDLDTTDFPFDIQTCTIFLHHAKNSGNLIRIHAHIFSIDLVQGIEIKENGAWKLIDKTIEGSEYSALFITCTMQRKPMYTILNIVLPIVVLVLLTPLVFLMPKDSGERFGFSVTMLLAISVYMTLIDSIMPKNSEPMPLITIILFVWYTLNSSIVAVVILNTRIYHVKKESPVPGILRRFVILTRKIMRRSYLRYDGSTEENDKFLNEVEEHDSPDGTNQIQEEQGDQKMCCIKIKKRHNQQAHGVTWQEISVAVDKWALFIYYTLIVFIPIFAAIMGHISSCGKDCKHHRN